MLSSFDYDYERHEYTLCENPNYKHERVRNRVFMTSQRFNMAELELSSVIFLIRHNGLSREPHVVKKGFEGQTKQKVSILTGLEISHLKSQLL